MVVLTDAAVALGDAAVLAADAVAEPVTWGQAIILGIVQGLTEFLPISSSAHLLIVSQLFGWSDPGAAFTAVTQIGTETAVVLYFRRDIWRIATAWLGQFTRPETRGDPDVSPDIRMGWLVIIGSIPIVVLGVTFSDKIETVARNLWLVSVTLIVFGVILGIADRMARSVKELRDLSHRDGIVYGLCQAMALIPGVSRSGATISGGLFLGYTREAATRYAFLLAIPSVLGAGVYQAFDIGDDPAVSWGPTILATIISFGVGLVVIAWLLRFVATRSYMPFVVYRVGLGLLVMILLSTGVLTSA